jgi:hypothetical protein
MADHVWSIGELIKEALDSGDVPPFEPPMVVREKFSASERVPTLRLISRGKR